MSRRSRGRHICKRKRRHASAEDASAHIRALVALDLTLRRPDLLAGLRAYRCEFCRGWHVGHDKGIAAAARRSHAPKRAREDTAMTADIAYQRLQAVEAALRALLEADTDEYHVARDTAAHVLEGRSYAEARTIALAFASERAAVRAARSDVIIEGSIALPVEPARVAETPPTPTRGRATRARRGATIADLEVPSAD